jgi:hypothetical protein
MGIPGTVRNSFVRKELVYHSDMVYSGLKINTAASPNAAYGITKSMIRDNGPGMVRKQSSVSV